MNPIFLQKLSYKLRLIPLLPKFLTYFIRLVFSCYLPYKLKLGKNFVLGYGGLGVVIHERTIIGENCHIDQNVTIGGTSKKHGVPVLGNHIYLGAGSKIIGSITIGDNVVVGANAVVVNDVPEGSLVVGIPGRVIKSKILKSDYV
jgi:serine O-acetyltransferase